MAQPADPHAFTPDDLADETLFDDDEPQTRPGVGRPRVAGPRSQPRSRVRAAGPRAMPPDPDAEALEIATRVVQKVAVAKSLVRIFGGLAAANASAAGAVLRAYADHKLAELVEQEQSPLAAGVAHVERAKKLAAAATEAAKHAARLAAVRAAARATEMVDEATAELDREDLSDDAC